MNSSDRQKVMNVGEMSGVRAVQDTVTCNSELTGNDSTSLLATHSMGTVFVSSRVKRPKREVHHSPPSSVEAKNEWRYTSASCTWL